MSRLGRFISIMKLRDYLHFNSIGKMEFAKLAKIPYTTFYRVLQGYDISLSLAKRIVDATEGQVSYEDLIKNIKEEDK